MRSPLPPWAHNPGYCNEREYGNLGKSCGWPKGHTGLHSWAFGGNVTSYNRTQAGYVAAHTASAQPSPKAPKSPSSLASCEEGTP